MRTKTLLCAAAIAASAITAMAQNVYSLNIVGYVNVPVASGYSILANPLNTGATNGANEIMPQIGGSAVLTYNAGAYTFRGYDDGIPGWIDETGAQTFDIPVLPPGKGFFYYNPNPATTYTFVGEVKPLPNTTNSMSIVSGYSLIGTPMPVGPTTLGSALTAGSPPVPGALNMPIIDAETILKYANNNYTFFGVDSGTPGLWIDATGGAGPAPVINVGEGFFFYNPGATAQWLQALP